MSNNLSTKCACYTDGSMCSQARDLGLCIKRKTRMMVETTEGLRHTTTQNAESSDLKALVKFLNGNTTTMGFSIQFAVNRSTGQVVEVFKKGKLVQRDIRALVALGFTEWMYSWAFSGKTFELESGARVKLTATLDLTKIADVLPWWRALGMV